MKQPVALALLFFASSLVPIWSSSPLDGFDATIESAIEEWQIPGLSVGVLVDGRVVYLRGFGVQANSDGEIVTPQTIFRLGNGSEPFTSFLIGGLVDEGKLDLDAPLVDYLPDFRLRDAKRARQLTVRDVLSQRTGLPDIPVAGATTRKSRRALLSGTRNLVSEGGLRESFQSSPWNVLIAEHLVERVVGQPWEQVVQKRIFSPLGMAESRLGTDGPLGDVRTSAEDLLKWLAVLLDDGVGSKRRFLEPATLRELIQPHVFVFWSSAAPFWPTTYGLFWGMNNYRGHYHVRLGGFGEDFESLISFFPADRVGVVILANRGGDTLTLLSALKFAIADRLFDHEPRDWIDWARKRIRSRR
jgi:CubicO group peptidase (beta-lactamase class C family)